MNKKINVISYIITMVLTMASLLWVVSLSLNTYVDTTVNSLIRFVVCAIFAGLVNAFAHEIAHLICGKKNKFAFSSMVVWFFKWSKVKKKIRFDLVMVGDEAGYTEMIPTTEENIEIKFTKMTRAGAIASIVVTILGVPPLFMTAILPSWVFTLWAMFFPIGIYYLFGTLLPASSYGVLNDGAVLYHFKKKTDTAKVMTNLLKIQASLYNGKTPAQIDEKLYFDLPQLPEDNPNFAFLLNARYSYYLDKEDYENAKKTTQRLLMLEEYLPKQFMDVIKVDALYNACTFDFNEETADDLMYELEKYINNVNNSANVRTKLAYLINVDGEKEGLDIFIKKGYKEADRCQIKGLGQYERKLLDRLLADFSK